jgi:hypothetical protein
VVSLAHCESIKAVKLLRTGQVATAAATAAAEEAAATATNLEVEIKRRGMQLLLTAEKAA